MQRQSCGLLNGTWETCNKSKSLRIEGLAASAEAAARCCVAEVQLIGQRYRGQALRTRLGVCGGARPRCIGDRTVRIQEHGGVREICAAHTGKEVSEWQSLGVCDMVWNRKGKGCTDVGEDIFPPMQASPQGLTNAHEL